jgi:HAD superfamily hydrolase (TIGR01549 family)
VIRLVTIDCWDTILRNNPVWDSLLVDIAQNAFGVCDPNISQEAVAAAFRAETAEFYRILKQEMVTPTLLARLRTLARFADIEMSGPVMRQLRTAFETAIFNPLPELVPGALKFLAKVKGKSLRLGLISNTGWFSSKAIGAALERLNVAQFFDFFAYSDQVGSAKPSARIFEVALAAAGCRPAEAIHIGDKLTTDVAGALKAGFGAIHFHTGAPCTDANVLCASDYTQVWTVLSSHLGPAAHL